MKPFTTHTGITAPIDRANIDTDAIIPKQFLRKTEKTGFGKHLFHEWRFTDYEGKKENAEFVLNQIPFRSATVLLARDNFGCGSSREHAPWALADYGFRLIIAPSFADIFLNNTVKNGILCVALKSSEVDHLFNLISENSHAKIGADLDKQIVISPDGKTFPFTIDAFSKTCLIKGLDQIGWTRQFTNKIQDYEEKLKIQRPWM